jgi:hypothetical protein
MLVNTITRICVAACYFALRADFYRCARLQLFSNFFYVSLTLVSARMRPIYGELSIMAVANSLARGAFDLSDTQRAIISLLQYLLCKKFIRRSLMKMMT